MLTVYKAIATDIAVIRKLALDVWPQTYSSILSSGQIDYMMELMYSEKSLQQQISDGSQFIIVYDEKEAVGFAAYQKLQPGVFKLHKIYVLPSQQGKGTGKFIINYIIDEIKKEEATVLQLQVNKNNTAKNFYEKLGFYVAEEIKVDIGNGYVMDDYLMEKKL